MQTTKLFQGKKVRAVWDRANKRWWISVVDICAVLCKSDYDTSRNYWKQLKHRLLAKNSRLTKTIHQLKMTAKDGKLRYTDVMDYKKIIQLIQLLPRETAKAFKAWVGSIAAKHCDLISQLTIAEFCANVGNSELVRVRTKVIFNSKPAYPKSP